MPLAALSLYGLPAYQIQKLQNPKLSEFWILRSLYSKKEIFFILDHCYEPLHHISIPLRLFHHHFYISISFLLQHHTFLLFSIQHHLHHISLSPPPPPTHTHTHIVHTHYQHISIVSLPPPPSQLFSPHHHPQGIFCSGLPANNYFERNA